MLLADGRAPVLTAIMTSDDRQSQLRRRCQLPLRRPRLQRLQRRTTGFCECQLAVCPVPGALLLGCYKPTNGGWQSGATCSLSELRRTVVTHSRACELDPGTRSFLPATAAAVAAGGGGGGGGGEASTTGVTTGVTTGTMGTGTGTTAQRHKAGETCI